MLVGQRSAEADENLHGENTGRHSTSMASFCLQRWNVPIIKPFHGLYHVGFGLCFVLGSCMSCKYSSASAS